jgi:hypothetical protein
VLRCRPSQRLTRYSFLRNCALQVAMGLCLCLTAVPLLFVLDLLLFHAILCFNERTTYDFIVSHRLDGPQSAVERCMSILLCQCWTKSNKVAADEQVQAERALQAAALKQASPVRQVYMHAFGEGTARSISAPEVHLGSGASEDKETGRLDGTAALGARCPRRTASEERDLQALHWLETGASLLPGELPAG